VGSALLSWMCNDVSKTFCRAMHVVLARYCYRESSFRLSICLSETVMYRERREHIDWTSSKSITGNIRFMRIFAGSLEMGRQTTVR